jgi:hypothetical protein
MTQQHPITPPPELVQQWMSEFYGTVVAPGEATTDIATRAAQWGADQELEACCEWGNKNLPVSAVHYLRAARRPKPPSWRAQALKALDDISIASFEQDAANIIRQALEQLDD